MVWRITEIRSYSSDSKTVKQTPYLLRRPSSKAKAVMVATLWISHFVIRLVWCFSTVFMPTQRKSAISMFLYASAIAIRYFSLIGGLSPRRPLTIWAVRKKMVRIWNIGWTSYLPHQDLSVKCLTDSVLVANISPLSWGDFAAREFIFTIECRSPSGEPPLYEMSLTIQWS